MTTTAPTFTACELSARVTFTHPILSPVTLLPGSVVIWTPGAEPGTIELDYFGHSATISQDDALPMEWDALDQMWVRA